MNREKALPALKCSTTVSRSFALSRMGGFGLGWRLNSQNSEFEPGTRNPEGKGRTGFLPSFLDPMSHLHDLRGDVPDKCPASIFAAVQPDDSRHFELNDSLIRITTHEQQC